MTIIANKNIWITGASSGIGEALAVACAKEGAYPILTARNAEKLQSIQAECLKHTDKCWVFPSDLSHLEQIDPLYYNVLNECGQIHLLVNNAGRSQRSFAIDTPYNNDFEIMQLNFLSVIKLSKLVLKHMQEKKEGHITVVGSITGKFGFPMRTAYAASKHALQGYFQSLQCEMTNEPIQVTIVHPGRIQTNISKNALTESGKAYNKMDDGQASGMSADLCAKKMIQAIRKNKKEVLVGGNETLMVRIHQFLPWLYHKIAPNIKN
ncbi:MAG: SDR family NAD(P)-dependent oxidoreductase [Mangrovibacterium sp.]